MFEVFAGLEHRLVGIVATQLLADDGVPEAVLVVVEVNGKVGCSFLPHFVDLWWFRVSQIFVLVGSLSSELLLPELLELRRSPNTNLCKSQVN